jgi:uncharacterized integral membrane protein
MERVPPEEERVRGEGRSRVGQVLTGILSILLIVLIVANNDSVQVDLLVTEVEAPLWALLSVTSLCGGFVGYLLRWRKRDRDRYQA